MQTVSVSVERTASVSEDTFGIKTSVTVSKSVQILVHPHISKNPIAIASVSLLRGA